MLSSNTAVDFIKECLCKINKKNKTEEDRLDVNDEKIGELSFDSWNLYQLDDTCTKVSNEYGIFRVIEKKNKKYISDELPNLVVMAGFSVNSFCGSSKIIMKNLEILETKYKAIYIICYDEDKFKQIQNNAFINIDKRPLELKLKRDVDSRIIAYKEEIDMLEDLGSIVDKVIRCLGLTNVHLLGKSSGGGLAMNIVYRNSIYTRLYLAVPAHPTFCKSFEKIGDRLNKMKIIIGWNQNDELKLGEIPSNQQMEYYDPILVDLKKKYAGFEYEQYRFQPGNKHEINPELLKLIAADI